MTEKPEIHVVVRNRKAFHLYEITDKYEAGIALVGTEVKSLRDGKVNLSDSYAAISNGEVILRNLNITPYKMSAHENHDPDRPRRLLLNKKEIRKLFAATEQKGMTLIPLMIYFKGKLAKVELGLGRGKKEFDKRSSIAEADAKRRIQRVMRKGK